ncbi:helix-turn-helix domain-containing protein [Paenibacillus eucommiae]|uniref:AraC-like DNA-binding protein n=1 Tax=Paenibacillus eucommiae TaxID=1355755 RepID=A0ABS4J5J9_9BACL|nr:helix-turn-helix domain-containing protein [Paenibacillus eucommiae]MBP1994064.1 AraC-like DNA-binding protein [Paenibacillus eucommiae]
MFRKRFLSRARQRVMLIRLIAFFLIISLLPLFIISSIFDNQIRSTMQQELLAANAKYVQQTVNAMESVTMQISSFFRQLSLDKVVREFERFPRGTYFESLTGEYREEDLPGMYSYLKSKEQTMLAIRKLKDSNEFIDSVYMLDRAKNLVLTSENLEYRPERFYDAGWEKDIQSLPFYPTVTEPRMAIGRDYKKRKVIPMVYASPETGNYIAVNLDVAALASALTSKMDGNNGSTGNTLFVLSTSGQLLLHDGDSQTEMTDTTISTLLPHMEQMGKVYSEQLVINDRASLLTAYTSDHLGWRFVTISSLEQLYAGMSKARMMIIVSCTILVAAIGLLIYAATRQIYNPVRHLLEFIHKNSGPNHEHVNAQSSEVRVIQDSFKVVIEDRASLQLRLLESLPANQEKFVYTLLHSHTLRADEIKERLAYLNLNLEMEGIFVWLVSMQGDSYTDVEKERLDKLCLIDEIRQCLPADHNSIVLEIVESQIVVLMNGDADELQDNYQLAECVIRQAEERLKLYCSIGIGEHCQHLSQLPASFNQAKEALRYRIMAGSCEVVYTDDVRMSGTPLFNYPKEKEEAFIYALINGESQKARGILAQMMRDFQEQEGKVHYHQIKHALIQLLSRIMAIANDIRIDLNMLLMENNNLFHLLQQKNNWKEITCWFEELVAKLSDYMGHAVRDKKNRHIEQVLAMLGQECGEKITLGYVAEQLGLNPSYLSRIFKDEQGITFLEHLTSVRIQRSKQLLEQTNLKIKDIGEQVGYLQTNYYIKLFKEFTGTTPGEYRKNLTVSR